MRGQFALDQLDALGSRFLKRRIEAHHAVELLAEVEGHDDRALGTLDRGFELALQRAVGRVDDDLHGLELKPVGSQLGDPLHVVAHALLGLGIRPGAHDDRGPALGLGDALESLGQHLDGEVGIAEGLAPGDRRAGAGLGILEDRLHALVARISVRKEERKHDDALGAGFDQRRDGLGHGLLGPVVRGVDQGGVASLGEDVERVLKLGVAEEAAVRSHEQVGGVGRGDRGGDMAMVAVVGGGRGKSRGHGQHSDADHGREGADAESLMELLGDHVSSHLSNRLAAAAAKEPPPRRRQARGGGAGKLTRPWEPRSRPT
ncbi:hypothetical protein D3C87_897560 [compost metagenome]